jgi:hypothetical protein
MAVPINESVSEASGSGSGGTLTITAPTGIADDDILATFIFMDGDAGAPVISGFTREDSFTTSQSTAEIFFLWKRASSESGNYDVTWTGNESVHGTMIRVSGCRTGESPVHVIETGVTGTGTTATPTALTTTLADCLVLSGVAVDREAVDSGDAPSGTGWTEVGTSGSSGGANGIGWITAENDQATAGTVESLTFGTWTSDGFATNMIALTATASPPSTGPTSTHMVNQSVMI